MQQDWNQWTLAKPIRLVATDMDGTLTHHGKFTPMLFEALERLASVAIPVVIVTGRSAGWVEAIAHYLPVTGAIAENGGLYFAKPDSALHLLVPIPDLLTHRQKLAEAFRLLQVKFPHLQEASDNRFRLTDWTFDVQGLSETDLQWMAETCDQNGWGFTYSTVQCHIKFPQQDKATALQGILQQYFPGITPAEIVTVGDSPNDESLFNPAIFPNSVGVANVREYGDRLTHFPHYLTASQEVQGFLELARYLQQLLQP